VKKKKIITSHLQNYMVHRNEIGLKMFRRHGFLLA